MIMREVREKVRKMKWSLIVDRSNQQRARQRFVFTWPHIWSKSVEISVDFPNKSAPLCASHATRPSRPIFAAVFQLKSGDFNGFIFFDNDFE